MESRSSRSRSPCSRQKKRRSLAEKIEKIGLLTHNNHPLSLESERRKATSIVYIVERELEHFQNKWLRTVSDDNVDQWLEFLILLRRSTPGGRSKTKNINWSDFKEFGDFLQKMKEETDVAMAHKRLFNQVEKIVTRAKVFEVLFFDSKEKLQEAVNDHVHKYCLSFCYESDAKDIVAAQEYENNINTWREEIKEGLILAEEKFKEYQNSIRVTSFDEYIQRYGRVLQMMNEVLNIFPKICSPIKDWVVADEVYPRKLLDEETKYNREKMGIAELLRRRHLESEARERKIQRAGFDSKKLNNKLHNMLMERKTCRRQEMTFQDTLNFIEDEIEINKDDLEDTLKKLKERKSNAPKIHDTLTNRVTYLEAEIIELKKRKTRMKENIMRSRKERYRIQKQIHQLKTVFDDSVTFGRKIGESVDKCALSSHALMDKQKQLVQKSNAARRIREIKIHPLTVKKVHAYGYSPGLIIDLTGMF